MTDSISGEVTMESHDRRKDDGLEVQAPGGWKIKATGQGIAIMILVVCGVAFIAYMIRDHDLRNVERAAVIATSQKEIVTGQKSVVESLDANTFVMVKCFNSKTECEKLNSIEMPDSLRRKVGR